MPTVLGGARQRPTHGFEANAGTDPDVLGSLQRHRVTVSTFDGETITATSSSDIAEFMRARRPECMHSLIWQIEVALLRGDLLTAGWLSGMAHFHFGWASRG